MTITLHEAQAGDSMTMYRIGNRDYPVYTDPNCHTCQSPHRQYIENELMLARPYAKISRDVAPLPTGIFPPPSAKSISKHAKFPHMAAPQAVRRRIIDDRAEELGESISGAESLLDLYVFNKMILAVGWERFMSGEINLSASDVMAAMQFQHKLDTTSNQGFDVQVMQDALEIYMDTAAEFIPKDRLDEYAGRLRANPVLKALARKARGEDEPPALDVEVVDTDPDEM